LKTLSQSKHIAVVGADSMGHGLAQLFAAKGHEVTLFDRNETILKAAVSRIESNLVFLSNSGLASGQDVHSATERIKLSADLEETITGARFVLETVEENLRIKRSLFREMERYCSPVTILATNTSTLRIGEIVAEMKVKERVVGTHFWTPPYLIPLAEVMGGRDTLPEVMDFVCNLLLSMDLHPVLINKDAPGFIGHRLQQALRREALSIVKQGFADPSAVVDVIKAGLGIHLSAMGLLDDADMADFGLRDRPHDVAESSSSSSSHLQKANETDEVRAATEQGGREPIARGRVQLVRQLIDWNRQEYRALHRK
jgi:3-hydroxybutyryl-CoA dehydrogenase